VLVSLPPKIESVGLCVLVVDALVTAIGTFRNYRQTQGEVVYRYETRIDNDGQLVYEKTKQIPEPNFPPLDDPGWITVPGDPNFPPEPKPDPRDTNVIRATRVQKADLYKRFPMDSSSQRVLILHPSDDTERVRCSMKVVAIEGQTPVQDYDALSYRWGKVHTDQFVWLEGVPVQVSDNLYAALFDPQKWPQSSPNNLG